MQHSGRMSVFFSSGVLGLIDFFFHACKSTSKALGLGLDVGGIALELGNFWMNFAIDLCNFVKGVV